MTFAEACDRMDAALATDARRRVVDRALSGRHRDMAEVLGGLRNAMRRHKFDADGDAIDLSGFVSNLDQRTRAEGFHALHDWDGRAAQVNAESIAVDVLDFVIKERGTEAADRTTVAILLDYYLMYILALLSLRVWDTGDPNENLDRVTALAEHLQGPRGSGHRFAGDAETLLLVATSHYEPEERGYHEMLSRVRNLDGPHRVRMALVHAAGMGSHLRFGIEATYGQDAGAMRQDNTADYPWLGFALVELVREYARLRGEGADTATRAIVAEALLNALSPDPYAFIGPLSATHAAHTDDRNEIRERLRSLRDDLVADFEPQRPRDGLYSPLALFCNFAFNVVKGTVVDALLWGEARQVSLNDLWTAAPRDEAESRLKLRLAHTLTQYARANPDMIRGRLMPVIVYDPAAGRLACGGVIRALRSVP